MLSGAWVQGPRAARKPVSGRAKALAVLEKGVAFALGTNKRFAALAAAGTTRNLAAAAGGFARRDIGV